MEKRTKRLLLLAALSLLIVPATASAKRVESCRDAKVMLKLADMAGTSRRHKRQIRHRQADICDGMWVSKRWKNGVKVKKRNRLYYPSGAVAKRGQEWFYPNGMLAVSHHRIFYPNGTRAVKGNRVKSPDGHRIGRLKTVAYRTYDSDAWYVKQYCNEYGECWSERKRQPRPRGLLKKLTLVSSLWEGDAPCRRSIEVETRYRHGKKKHRKYKKTRRYHVASVYQDYDY